MDRIIVIPASVAPLGLPARAEKKTGMPPISASPARRSVADNKALSDAVENSEFDAKMARANRISGATTTIARATNRTKDLTSAGQST